MKMTEQPALILDGKPPRELLPLLVEWWLLLCSNRLIIEDAKIFQIEAVDINDKVNPFIYDTKAFILGEKTPSMIISANRKTKTLVCYAEDTEGDPIIDLTTNEPQQKTLHSESIFIYRCLPLSTINHFKESGMADLLGK